MNPDLPPGTDPIALFQEWLAAAAVSEINDPNAMTLATVDAAGLPDARMVLLKDCDSDGFVFFTNRESAKGRQLAAHPAAALVFHWKSLRRQVRARGPVAEVSVAEADAHYATRPRLSRIGAWASRQSRSLDGRATLEQAVARFEAEFGDGPIPRPEHWTGFRLAPAHMEFWIDRPYRLHDRFAFTRPPGGGWAMDRLYP